MAIGPFRNFLTTFSSFLTLAALALVIFAIVGPVNKSGLDTIHFIRLDFSTLNLGEIASESNIATSLINAATSGVTFSAADFGFENTYIITPWGYCSSDDTGANAKMNYCSKAKALYYFNIEEFLQSQLSLNQYSSTISTLLGSNTINISLPDKVSDYEKTIETVSKLIFICGFIAIGAFALNLLNNIVAKRSKIFSCGSFILSVIGSVAVLLTAGASTGMYVIVKDKIKSEIGDTGIVAYIDPVYYGLIWGSFGAGVLSTIGWFFSICCGSTSHEYVDDEKE